MVEGVLAETVFIISVSGTVFNRSFFFNFLYVLEIFYAGFKKCSNNFHTLIKTSFGKIQMNYEGLEQFTTAF